MIIPIGTEVRPRKPPVGNYLLIGLNIAIFLFTDGLGGSYGQQLKSMWALYSAVPDVGQYVTYQFLHGDWMHLLGNMLFLWIFGNAVCDRMGSFAYVLFYLASGVFAGMTFASLNDNALVGASGAIAAVTTAFLALYPRVRVTVLFFMIIITFFQIPATFLIVFKIILWDNILAPSMDQGALSNVAYSAHLGGYAFGFLVAMGLLMLRLLPRNQFDLLAVWSRWQRRAGFKPAGPTLARPVRVREMDSRPLDPIEPTPAERLRSEVLELVHDRDAGQAAARYLELLKLDPGHVLPRQAQLDVANALAQSGRYAAAAEAYEAYLGAYPAADVDEVRLLLGLIYARYLNEPGRAIEHLRAARLGLRTAAQRSLADDELRALGVGLED